MNQVNQLLNATATFKQVLLAVLIFLPFYMAITHIIVKHSLTEALREIEKEKQKQ